MATQHYGVDQVASHGDFASEDITRKQFISGHFGFSFAQPLLAERFAFTFLRDPVDRVISLYNFCRSQGGYQYPTYLAAKRWNIEEFVENAGRKPTSTFAIGDAMLVHEAVWNNLTWQLAHGWFHNMNEDRKTVLDIESSLLLETAKNNLRQFDYVGTTETFSADCRVIFEELAMRQPALIARENMGSQHIKRQDIPLRILNKIHEITELDAELYVLAKKLRKHLHLKFKLKQGLRRASNWIG